MSVFLKWFALFYCSCIYKYGIMYLIQFQLSCWYQLILYFIEVIFYIFHRINWCIATVFRNIEYYNIQSFFSFNFLLVSACIWCVTSDNLLSMLLIKSGCFWKEFVDASAYIESFFSKLSNFLQNSVLNFMKLSFSRLIFWSRDFSVVCLLNTFSWVFCVFLILISSSLILNSYWLFKLRISFSNAWNFVSFFFPIWSRIPWLLY